MALLVFLFSTIFVSSIFYYLFLTKGREKVQCPSHPPSPKGLPILGNLLQLGLKPHRTLHSLSKVYGPLLRLRLGYEETVVVASAAVATEFFLVNDANFSNRPPAAVGEHMLYNYQDLAFAPYGPRWRMLRKLSALHLLSPKALDNLRPVREAEVALLIRTLFARSGHGTVDLSQALNVCVTNALSRSTFSKRVFEHEAKDEAAAEFKEMVREFMELSGIFFIADFVPALRWFDFYGQNVIRKMKILHRRFDAFFDKVIREHSEAAVEEEGDLLGVLMRLKEEGDSDGAKLTSVDIKALLLDLFTAGTDTTSISIEWAIAEMIRCPDILKNAQNEIDTVVGRDRLVCESDLPNLPFLQAIVKETLRLHPPAPLSVPRKATDACVINGYTIAKDTTVLLHIWAIGRDPEVWRDPLEFSPGRFLPGSAHQNVDVRGKHFEMVPFGAGRRICVGLSFGLRMVQLLTATLVHAFDWALPKGQIAVKLDMEEAYGLTLQRAVPLMVHPLLRLPQHAYETV